MHVVANLNSPWTSDVQPSSGVEVPPDAQAPAASARAQSIVPSAQTG
jgi:hypothetical protein